MDDSNSANGFADAMLVDPLSAQNTIVPAKVSLTTKSVPKKAATKPKKLAKQTTKRKGGRR